VRAEVVVADLAVDGSARRLHRQVAALLPPGASLDLVCANAGAASHGRFLGEPAAGRRGGGGGAGGAVASVGTAAAVAQAQVALNVVGTTQLLSAFAPRMAAQGRGHLLAVSSVTAGCPNPGVAVYAASKAYLRSLGAALRHELAPLGVGVTVALPGPLHGTAFFAAAAVPNRALYSIVPGYSMASNACARQLVDATLNGAALVVPGALNKLWLHGACPLLPPSLRLAVVDAMWAPLPRLAWPRLAWPATWPRNRPPLELSKRELHDDYDDPENCA
jgi:hypothetical protein